MSTNKLNFTREMLRILNITQYTMLDITHYMSETCVISLLVKLYFTDVADILKRTGYYNYKKSLREVIQVILLFIRGCLGSQSGHFLPTFIEFCIVDNIVFRNSECFETLSLKCMKKVHKHVLKMH